MLKSEGLGERGFEIYLGVNKLERRGRGWGDL